MLLTVATPLWEQFRQGDALYQEIVENAIVVTGARYVNLSWYDAATNEITGSAWSIRPRGIMDDAMRAARAIVPGFSPIDVRFSAEANPAVHRVLVEGHPHFAPFGDHVRDTVHPAMIKIAQTIMGLRWTHSVPLRIGPVIVGALAYHFVDRPSEDILTFAEAFAQQAALTLENARMSEALDRRARDLESSRARIGAAEERARREIAQLLHGRVETRLLVATERVLECAALVPSDPGRAAAAIADIADELDRIRDEDVRRASHRLHPSAIAVGLIPALELLGETIGRRIEVRLEVSPAAAELDSPARNALPQRVRLGLYRFTEEALLNAARHSGVTRAHVAVDVDGAGSLRVAVTDEGVGFDPASAPEGVGLPAMRDHIERLGGAVHVMSTPKVGTRSEAFVPIGQPGERAERRRWPRSQSGSAAAGSNDVLQRIAENALAVTDARFISLSLYEPRERVHALGAIAPLPLFSRLLAAARAVIPGFDPSAITFPADVNPATARVLLEGQPLLAPLTEHAKGAIPAPILQAAVVVLGVKWVHSVPLHVAGRVAGALAFHFASQPLAEKLPVTEAFAKQAALTLENVHLSDALRERAEELTLSRERIAETEERTRREIAELLHGHVQTRLLVATHRLLECRPLVASDPAAAVSALRAVAADLDRIRENDVRQASRQLHPAVLRVGLVAALEQLAESLGPRIDVRVEASDEITRLDDPRRNALPDETRLGVYRFVEEALANVARHAGTDAASVRLGVATGCLRIVVEDRGHGFDPTDVREGVGLRSMRDRIERLGGGLLVASSALGTAVTATLPLMVIE